MQARNVTHATVGSWVDGSEPWPRMCGLALSKTHSACGRPGPLLNEAAAAVAQRDIAEWLAAVRAQQEAEAALQTQLTAQGEGGGGGGGGGGAGGATTTNVPPTDAAKQALVAIAAALRGESAQAGDAPEARREVRRSKSCES
jgi:hypothetical protein